MNVATAPDETQGIGDPREPARGPVLVVEDDRAIRESLAWVLEDEHVDTVTAANGQEALELLRQGARPCLILLDLMMPRMSGWQLAAELQRDPELAAIPVVLLSGVEEVHRDAPLLRADGYLRKPIDAALLIEVVKGYAGR